MYLEDKELDSVLEAYFESISINEGIIQKYKDKKEAKKKEQEEKRQQEYYNRVKKAYQNLIKFLDYPFDFGWEGYRGFEEMIHVAKSLKISESQFVNRIKKIKFKNYTLEKGIINFYEENAKSIKELEQAINKKIKTNGANLQINVIEIHSNDDNIDYIGQDGKVYSIQTDDTVYIESVYKNDDFLDDHGSDFDKNKFNQWLIKADQELGYYILSQPPKGTQKKKLPL